MKATSRFVLAAGVLVLTLCALVLACRQPSGQRAGANAGALMNMNQMTFVGTMSGDATVPAAMTYSPARCTSGDGGTCTMSFPLPLLSSGEVDIVIASQQADGGHTGGTAKYACGIVSGDASCIVSRACTATSAYAVNDAGHDAGWATGVTIGEDGGCTANVTVGGTKNLKNINWAARAAFLGIP